VPAAAVAAGLRVRLVDVDARGRIDVDALARTPLDEACAVVVGNLFGLAEPVDRIAAIASAAGCALVDDAAQAFGASDASGPVGGRGDVGVLSFGRGKPLSALGGGALAWPPEREPGLPAPAVPAPRPGRAAVRALAWDAALQPAAFRALAAVPALHIGETVFDPAIRPDPIDGAAAALLPVAVARAAADAARRRDAAGMLAARIASATAWVPLLADSGTVGVYPRLGLLGPDATARDAALVALTRVGAGASRLYPRSLDGLPALGPHLVDPTSCPGARGLAARVLTLPTHGALRGRRLDEVLDILSAPSRS